MNFKNIDSLQKFVKGELDNFEEKIDKSTFPENENYKANITIKITFTKGTYSIIAKSLKTEHKRTERIQSQESDIRLQKLFNRGLLDLAGLLPYSHKNDP